MNIELELNGGARVLTLSPQPRCLDARILESKRSAAEAEPINDNKCLWLIWVRFPNFIDLALLFFDMGVPVNPQSVLLCGAALPGTLVSRKHTCYEKTLYLTILHSN